MPRLLDPAFVEQVRDLGLKGYSQTQIAKMLNTNQPRISYIMKRHNIPLEHYGTRRRNAVATAGRGLHVYVCIMVNGTNKVIREQDHVTPDQLRALATYAEGLDEHAAALVEASV